MCGFFSVLACELEPELKFLELSNSLLYGSLKKIRFSALLGELLSHLPEECCLQLRDLILAFSGLFSDATSHTLIKIVLALLRRTQYVNGFIV